MDRTQTGDFASPGFTPDVPELSLPGSAWTDSRNVRYRDGAIEKFRGYTQALGDLSVTAIWAQPVGDGVNQFWVYAGNTAFYGTDGTTHTSLNGPSETYAATDDLGWTGGAFHGYALAVDGTNRPRSWQASLSNKFVELANWPSNLITKVIRPHKDFIFALRNSTSGSYNPRELRWSDKAQQGALPGSWDYTDPTNQAGITELGQTDDLLVDCLGLGDDLYIYKESHTFVASYVGGLDVFGFREVFSELGMLTEGCAAAFTPAQGQPAQHLVLTADDLVVHNGASAQSVVDKRARRWLFNRINSNRFKRCFVFADPSNREVYVCFPESGVDWPNLALVWNWAENSLQPFDLGGSKTFARRGIIPGAAVTFDTDTPGSFDAATSPFDEETYSAFNRKNILLDSAMKKAYQMDTGETYNGTQMSVYASRSGHSLTADLGTIKRVWKLFPQVTGMTVGDTLRFYIGVRDTIGSAVTWSGPYAYTYGIDNWVDVRLDARIIDLRVEYNGANTFRLYGIGTESAQSGSR